MDGYLAREEGAEHRGHGARLIAEDTTPKGAEHKNADVLHSCHGQHAADALTHRALDRGGARTLQCLAGVDGRSGDDVDLVRAVQQVTGVVAEHDDARRVDDVMRVDASLLVRVAAIVRLGARRRERQVEAARARDRLLLRHGAAQEAAARVASRREVQHRHARLVVVLRMSARRIPCSLEREGRSDQDLGLVRTRGREASGARRSEVGWREELVGGHRGGHIGGDLDTRAVTRRLVEASL